MSLPLAIDEIVDTIIILLKGRRSSLLQTYHHAGAIFTMYMVSKSRSKWLYPLQCLPKIDVRNAMHEHKPQKDAMVSLFHPIVTLIFTVPPPPKKLSHNLTRFSNFPSITNKKNRVSTIVPTPSGSLRLSTRSSTPSCTLTTPPPPSA